MAEKKKGIIKHGLDYGEDVPEDRRIIPSSTNIIESARTQGRPVTAYDFFMRPGASQVLGDLLAGDQMDAAKKKAALLTKVKTLRGR